jgi:class 3 adenylate cyclase
MSDVRRRDPAGGQVLSGMRRATSGTGRTAPREVRKAVSIVFCDVTGSTSLGERLDPESIR